MLELLTGLLLTLLITVNNCEEIEGLKLPVINTAYYRARDPRIAPSSAGTSHGRILCTQKERSWY